ncbi:hypothetical protein ANCDUO_16773 [Ancylostoma duodenale]|uniref:Peptidase M12A domain-containing protein n=1 Tax=Ancylostoma duodenale TaxID=51022 RepID=A0A0C2CTH5_9BILA|nr:hypothetical protein ANCDUO_16773 [Ancylostoma duodenale]
MNKQRKGNAAISGSSNQFGLTSFEPDPYGIPYDFYSIMHYPKDAGAKKRSIITIETLDKQYQVGF